MLNGSWHFEDSDVQVVEPRGHLIIDKSRHEHHLRPLCDDITLFGKGVNVPVTREHGMRDPGTQSARALRGVVGEWGRHSGGLGFSSTPQKIVQAGSGVSAEFVSVRSVS